jgi:epoxyqueuosine reductase
MTPKRPEIRFIPMSTDPEKIRFFGTLMPALLLLKSSPLRFLQYQFSRNITPKRDIAQFIREETDDAGQSGNVVVFLHRWRSLGFDPFTFARAKIFLARVTRMIRRAGYAVEPYDPLTPDMNLPKLAEQAGLGNLSPFGLLVNAGFGPRVILTGIKTNYPLEIFPRWSEGGCSDCMACVRICPQNPLESGEVSLRLCQSCAKCLEVCPTGRKT